MSCPICGKPPATAYRPFCSRRCADVDLGRWLSGSYAVPAERDGDEEELDRALDAARQETPKKPH
jgi:endogenous inhibitor of DNA gyrase (YacG/DUF329 family)